MMCQTEAQFRLTGETRLNNSDLRQQPDMERSYQGETDVFKRFALSGSILRTRDYSSSLIDLKMKAVKSGVFKICDNL